LNPIERSLGSKLNEEQVQRTLLELYQDEDWSGLLATAELLNTAWHQESMVKQWLAREATDNLTQRWQTTTSNLQTNP
jgi:HEAT repeat protein